MNSVLFSARNIFIDINMARKKGRKKKQNKCEEDAVDDADDAEKKVPVRTVKTQLKNVLLPEYREILIAAISEKSIISTQICCLASLLFLHRAQTAFTTNHRDFFLQNGDAVIRQCFFDITKEHARKEQSNLEPEFREIVREFEIELPGHSFFGNAMNELIDTYSTNVKNNLIVHQAKRFRQFLIMKIYQVNNLNPLVGKYTESDINRIISLGIYANDSITPDGIESVSERARRDLMLGAVIHDHSWFDIPDSNIGRYTKVNWFKSIQFWLSIQRQIDEFNTTADQREDRKIERAQYKERQRCKRRNHENCTCKQPENESKTEKGPPRVKNLSVIPICNFKRKHYTLDNSTLHSLLCETDIIPLLPKEKGQKGRPKRAISRREFFENNFLYWSQVFDMRKINRLVHCKKKFRCRILSNGQSVSLQFSVDKKDCIQFDKETIVREYKQNKFEIEAATDPGEKTWSATVIRNIQTGKEVMLIHSFYILHFCLQSN